MPSTEYSKRSPDVIAAEAVGDTVLLNATSWTYLNLNATGSFLWDCLSQARSTAWLIDAAQQRFDAPVGTIKMDVEEFITNMIENGFVVRDYP